jgi:Ran GTPase-activating protein (RanGAP) involved in mRNA processing and transport
MSAQLESSEAAILSRVIQPDSADWSRAASEAILGIGFNETDREQMSALLEKAKTGDLTNEESEALEHYRHIGKLLELMKSRARRSLQTSPA